MNIDIEQQLKKLIATTSSDFSALACIKELDHTIHWKYATGNSNERFRHMVGKPGKGIAGSVFRFGREIVLDQDTVGYDKIRLGYPIMLAENLLAAIAVPLFANGKIRGVLVTGSRSIRKYTVEEINQVKETAGYLSSIFNH
nr:GAF domain-containing protein [Fredinandcohnia sp. SECRCQ15]